MIKVIKNTFNISYDSNLVQVPGRLCNGSEIDAFDEVIQIISNVDHSLNGNLQSRSKGGVLDKVIQSHPMSVTVSIGSDVKVVQGMNLI